MAFSRKVARLNRNVFNHVAKPLSGKVGPFSLLQHVGRTSGKTFTTPIFAFRNDGGFVIALTYGSNSDWVKNVLASGGCTLTYRRAKYTLTDPLLITSNPREQPLPAVIRTILHRGGFTDFLLVKTA